jgi:hypothetical protein
MERAERLSSQWGAGSKNGHPLPSAHLNNYTIKFLGKDILWDGSEPASAVAGEQRAFAGQPERSSGQATPNARGQRSSSVADQPDDGKITTHDKLMDRLQGTLRALDRMGRPEIADQKELSPLAGEAKPLGRAAKSLQGINGDMLATRRDQTLTPAEKRQRLDALTVERNQLLKDAVMAAKAAQHDR